MKKITTVLFVALVVLGSLPVFAASTSASAMGSLILPNMSTRGGYYRVYARDTDQFTIYLARGHNDIVVTGDGSTDLDLYVYDGDGDRFDSAGNSDDEKVCLNVNRAGYFTVRIVNRGTIANDYQLIIK